jgi:hypothetical protein
MRKIMHGGNLPMFSSTKKSYILAVIFVAVIFLVTAASAFAESNHEVTAAKDDTQSKGFYIINATEASVAKISDQLLSADSIGFKMSSSVSEPIALVDKAHCFRPRFRPWVIAMDLSAAWMWVADESPACVTTA